MTLIDSHNLLTWVWHATRFLSPLHDFIQVNPVLWFSFVFLFIDPCCHPHQHSCPQPCYIVSSFRSLMILTNHTNKHGLPCIFKISPLLLMTQPRLMFLTPEFPASPQYLPRPPTAPAVTRTSLSHLSRSWKTILTRSRKRSASFESKFLPLKSYATNPRFANVLKSISSQLGAMRTLTSSDERFAWTHPPLTASLRRYATITSSTTIQTSHRFQFKHNSLSSYIVLGIMGMWRVPRLLDTGRALVRAQ